MTFIEIVRLREINLNKNKEMHKIMCFFCTNMVELNLAHIRSLINKNSINVKTSFQ